MTKFNPKIETISIKTSIYLKTYVYLIGNIENIDELCVNTYILISDQQNNHQHFINILVLLNEINSDFVISS